MTPLPGAGQQQARILEYWRAVEMFSPQNVPRLNPASKTEPVLRGAGAAPLPWDPLGWFPPSEAGRNWRFTAFCGLYQLGSLSARLERQFSAGQANYFERRPQGESCLFAVQITAAGRPLLDTFVLASAPWAVGRLHRSGSGNAEWLQGFEAAAAEQALRFAERFAVRENDEIGRKLLEAGWHVGRPIQPGDLEFEGAEVAAALGVSVCLTPSGSRLRGRQVLEKYSLEADSDDFLNSFFLRDLGRVAAASAEGKGSAALARFLTPNSELALESRRDVRTAVDVLWRNTAPSFVPAGRWPSSAMQSLYFSQQFAINSALQSFDGAKNPLFAINGPPGTGKTTLLREVMASVVVRRAQALATLERPHLAFEEKPEHWHTAGQRRPVHLWKRSLLGFEIVVASSNNRAVENVTLEIPAKGAVDEALLPEENYFADFATRLLEEKKDEAGGPVEAWALIAARLGNRKNRREFMKRFWGVDKQLPEPRDRAHDGFFRYLKSLRPGPRNVVIWKRAVASFNDALKAEAAVRERRCADWQTAQGAEIKRRLAGPQAKLEGAIKARREHHQLKPELVDAVFTLGKAYREWRATDLGLSATVERCQAECDEARKQLEADFPGPATWNESPEQRELSSPWADESWNRARTRVFIEALHLHRTFIECAPVQIRENLAAAMDVLSGKISPGGASLQSAWATLFFVVPVVSTTFASFDRLFANCERESLGWLLIDEAGQAVPQAVMGALWRAQRVVVVGDPRQLEPIVPLSFTAQQALRCHFGVEETWLPSENSAQSLADRVSPLGTWIAAEDAEQPIWVGCPLRAHRRCQRPMFDISNVIAYQGQMVFATEELACGLLPSSWIDIAASESDDHWIPAEGIALEILLSELLGRGAKASDILLLSPFRAVARQLRWIAARHNIRLRGTVHVSQGKEAAVVILVLGGDPRRQGAKEWASEKPNLLNVAVSRAKQRLYIIGNRDEWSQYPNFAEASALLSNESKRASAAGRR